MYYFKSNYELCNYSPDWYGTLDYAPPATVLIYDDDHCFCIGYMEVNDANVEYITEEEALNIINNSEGELVYKNEKLESRWLDGEQI